MKNDKNRQQKREDDWALGIAAAFLSISKHEICCKNWERTMPWLQREMALPCSMSSIAYPRFVYCPWCRAKLPTIHAKERP